MNYKLRWKEYIVNDLMLGLNYSGSNLRFNMNIRAYKLRAKPSPAVCVNMRVEHFFTVENTIYIVEFKMKSMIERPRELA